MAKSKFDPSKDKTHFTVSAPGDSKTEFEVAVRQYGTGEPKIQISRFVVDEDKTTYIKLGRISRTEIKTLIEMLIKAQKALESPLPDLKFPD